MEPRDPTLEDLIPDLMRLARILAPDPATAEDIAQEALLKVWTRLAQGGEIADLRPYLMTVLRRHGHWTRESEHQLDSDSVVAEGGHAGLQQLTLRDVRAAIARLPAKQADLLHDVAAGRSYRDMATRRDVPMGTIMSRVARARAGLRAQLQLRDAQDLSDLLAAFHQM